MREIKLSLGGEEITVRELGVMPNKAWRDQLEQPLLDMAKLLELGDKIEINTVEDISATFAQLKVLLLNNLDLVPDLVIAYSPLLTAKRDWLLNNATEEEFLAAFVAIMGVAYPVSFFTQQASGLLKNGYLKQAILTNLRARSGASGLTS